MKHLIVFVLLCLFAAPVLGANVRFACEAAGGYHAAVFTAPATDAKADYQVGEIVVIEATTGVAAYALQIQTAPVTTYRGSGQSYARETRYLCQQIDPADIPAALRWPSRRR